MRSFVTKGGFPTFINSRESAFLDSHFAEDIILERKALNERDAYIAQNLVGRGVLDKVTDGKKTGYKLNINKYGKL